MNLRASSLLFLLFASTSAFGQVTGKIIDGTNVYPLEYATAALYDQENGELVTGVITDLEGVFIISDVKKGIYYLKASFIGYQPKTLRDLEVKNRNTPLDVGAVELSIGENQLSEVVVQGNGQRSSTR